MGLLNEEALFERHGDRYVMRLTPFSAGCVISEAQKDALFAGLKRVDRHTAIEALLAVTLIVTLFLTGLLRSETPALWIFALSTLVLAGLTVRSLRQRGRLLKRAVGNRPPDLPHLPFWGALWKSRPPTAAERFGVPSLSLALALLVVLLAGGDALAILVIAAVDAPAQQANVEEILSPTFWLALLVFNPVVVAMIVALGFESRRLRRRPGT